MKNSSDENTLDFLRQKRTRTHVPERNTSILNEASTIQIEASEQKESIASVKKVDSKIELDNHPLKTIKAELEKLPNIARRSNIRVDEEILERAEQDFKKARITFETFFEAAYAWVEQNPELKEKLFNEAKDRKKLRDRAGQLRRDLARLDTYDFS